MKATLSYLWGMAPPSAILETCLSVENLAHARAFYTDFFGYPVMRFDERFCAFDIGGNQVLLLFVCGSDPGGTVLPFGTIPPHGSGGVSHIGFRVPAGSLAAWRGRLDERGISIESEFQWSTGGTSTNPAIFHVSATAHKDYQRHMNAEQRTWPSKRSPGGCSYHWHQFSRHNHLHDCELMCLGRALQLGLVPMPDGPQAAVQQSFGMARS